MDNNIPSKPLPILWNPTVAALWSLLFSPAFGAYLHAKNADALGRNQEAKANRLWLYIFLCLFGLFLILSIFTHLVPETSNTGIALALYLSWFFPLGYKQIRYVKENLQSKYQKKKWAKPLLIACCFVITYLLFCFVSGIISVMLEK